MRIITRDASAGCCPHIGLLSVFEHSAEKGNEDSVKKDNELVMMSLIKF